MKIYYELDGDSFSIKQIEDYKEKPAPQEVGLGEMTGQSSKMKDLYRLIQQISGAEGSVLIVGESGTGKELAARAIHELSSRKDKPFLKAHGAGLERQFERIAAADGGTFFLDEIAELPMDLQEKMTRLLREKLLEKKAGGEPSKVNLRIIAATNRNLHQLAGAGRFRSELFYLLDSLTLFIPPLRERKDDIPLLTQHFVGKQKRELSKLVSEMEPGFMDCLMRYDWPGNVRELENTVQRTILLASTPTLSIKNLPLEIQALAGRPTGTISNSLWQSKEKEIILQVLKEESGNKLRAARKLGMGRTTLWRKLKEYNIEAA